MADIVEPSAGLTPVSPGVGAGASRPISGSREEVWRIQVILYVLLPGANLIGAGMVVALLAVVIPGPSIFEAKLRSLDILIPLYICFAAVVGIGFATVRTLRDLRWFTEGRSPTPREQQIGLALPFRLAMIQAGLWFGGLVLSTAIVAVKESVLVPNVFFTVAFAGIMVCSIAYVMSEIVLRPVAAAALSTGYQRRKRITGVTGRSILGWLLGTGVPVTGLMVLAVLSLVRHNASADRMSIVILVVGGIVMVVGLLLTVLTAWAIVAPVKRVRTAMALVEQGHLDTEVEVFDGTELGELQWGFNNMAGGLRERERIRDVFGKHVGHHVAERALSDAPSLGGEERMVAVFFIDMIGSTTLASQTDPTTVVALLNRFFKVVVDEVDSHGGFINKFEGDGALAVFGAPGDMEDAAGSALATVRAIMDRLASEVPEVGAAVGVSYGRAVAGNVGHHERYEYTVIGDPVNEAARIAELAKNAPGRILASSAAVNAAEIGESWRWHVTETVTLRGRAESTELAIPVM